MTKKTFSKDELIKLLMASPVPTRAAKAGGEVIFNHAYETGGMDDEKPAMQLSDDAYEISLFFPKNDWQKHVLDVFRDIPISGTLIDKSGHIVNINREMAAWCKDGSPIGRHIDEIDVFRDFSNGTPVSEALQDGENFSLVIDKGLDTSGVRRWVNIRCFPVGENGTLMLLSSDISERKNSISRLELAATVFHHAKEGIVITDKDAKIIDVNAAFEDITQYRKNEVVGRTPSFLSGEENPKIVHELMWQILLKDGFWHGELNNRRKDGTTYIESLTISAIVDNDGNITNYVGLLLDISGIRNAEQRIHMAANYDALTGLPNRRKIVDMIQDDIGNEKSGLDRIGVICLDLDGFKNINEKHGHETGDAILVNMSERIRTALSKTDTFGRVGGDEFIAVIRDTGELSDTHTVMTNLLKMAAEPFHVGDKNIELSASVGATFWPQGNDIDAEQLLRQADQAMYQAKMEGKNRYHVFDELSAAAVKGLRETHEMIRKGIANREFVLHYQPKASMNDGKIIGAEALIRWKHPSLGMLYPDAFLPIIEGTDIANELGEYVIDMALAQISEWENIGFSIHVSVNIAGKHMLEPSFMANMEARAKKHENNIRKLELEILESSALSDINSVSNTIRACGKLGISVSIDDFGTGYSSLMYLKALPADTLKIDKSFIFGMLENSDDLAILQGVIGLSQAFKRNLIAEGVETEKHGLMLMHLGCNNAQGYGIAKPMPPELLPGWCDTWVPPKSWSCKNEDIQRVAEGLIALSEHKTCCSGESHTGDSRLGKWLENEARIDADGQAATILDAFRKLLQTCNNTKAGSGELFETMGKAAKIADEVETLLENMLKSI